MKKIFLPLLAFVAFLLGLAPLHQAQGASLMITTNGTLDTILAGSPCSISINATGGTPPYKFILTPGTKFPKELNINPDTGVISGFPTARSNSIFWVNVNDSNSQTKRKSFTLNI